MQGRLGHAGRNRWQQIDRESERARKQRRERLHAADHAGVDDGEQTTVLYCASVLLWPVVRVNRAVLLRPCRRLSQAQDCTGILRQ